MTIDDAITAVLIAAALSGEVTDIAGAEADLRCIMARNGGWIVERAYEYSIRRVRNYYQWTGGRHPLVTEGAILISLCGRVLDCAGLIGFFQPTADGYVIAWSPPCE